MKAMSKGVELKAMLAGVDRLAAEMKKKLREKARQGYSGGLNPSNWYMVTKMLHEHVDRLTGMCPHCKAHDGEHDQEETARQAIDVCNLAMMLWVLRTPMDRTRGCANGLENARRRLLKTILRRVRDA